MDAFQSLSESLAALAAQAGTRLFHVPSPLGGRTALGFDGSRLLVPALEAEEGEELTILAPGGSELQAKVLGFDPGLGLAVLGLAEPRPATAWKASASLPGLGSLVLAVAFPSPEGPEARLDTVRFAGGVAEAAYIQTDGRPFPGFAGGALAAPSGELAGLIVANGSGNQGWALPAFRAAVLIDSIVGRGFPGTAWLGVSTMPVESPQGLLITGLETGGPAETGGLLVGDLILSASGTPLASPEDLRKILDGAKPGEDLELGLTRGGVAMTLKIKTGTREKGRNSGGAGCCGPASGPGGESWDCCAGR